MVDDIYIGLGANLQHPLHGPPLRTLEQALKRFEERGLHVLARSHWYESAPIPVSDQPWYVNGVVKIATDLDPVALLGCLQSIEAEFGRIRSVQNAARVLDLDIVAYGDLVREGPDPQIPHPRMAERGFVLLPLADLDPNWRHPATKQGISTLIASLPPNQATHLLRRS